MPEKFSRLENLLGMDDVNLLAGTRVAVFGMGGAGSFAVEALARCGIGSFALIDPAVIQKSHMNRHLYAMAETVGMSKVEAAKQHIRSIDDNILVKTYETFFNEDSVDLFDFEQFDYVIDVMDSVASKLLAIKQAKAVGVPLISCMELGNRRDASALCIGTLKDARTAFAKMMLEDLKSLKMDDVKILYSRERVSLQKARKFPLKLPSLGSSRSKTAVQTVPLTGSISYVYGQAGMMLASEVVGDLLRKETNQRKR